MKGTVTYVVGGTLGLVAGLLASPIGTLFGVVLTGVLSYLLIGPDNGPHSIVGNALFELAIKYDLLTLFILCTSPVGGAPFGLLGAIAGLTRRRKQDRNTSEQVRVSIVWGAIAGALYSLIVAL